jgi:hypothetical protein
LNSVEAEKAVAPAGSIFFYAFVLFLLLAPLYKAGNLPLPMLLLELGAIAFLFASVAAKRTSIPLPNTMWAAMGILLVYPLVQLAPLPQFMWAALPGHAEYATVFERFADKSVVGVWRAISVIPTATEYGWLALLPPLACLLAAMRLSAAHAALLLLIMATFAGLESLLGLMQVGAGSIESILYLGNKTAYGAATGTFVNRNHLAAMLAMTLPVMVGLLAFSMRPGRRRLKRHIKSEVIAQRAMLFASAVLVLLCILFTRSKAGIASAFVGLVCSAIVLVRARAASEGTSRTRTATFVVVAMAGMSIILAVIIGISPILERFKPGETGLLGDSRITMYAATFRAALEFLPFGSGLSTFAYVFPRFQVGPGFGGFVEFAHNDYLQAFMELGLAGPIIILLLLTAYIRRMVELLWREGGRSFTLLQLGAGLGLLPMILHSLFDFALHMPANAMWFATLAGVMFHKGVDPRTLTQDEQRVRQPVAMPDAAVTPEIPAPS